MTNTSINYNKGLHLIASLQIDAALITEYSRLQQLLTLLIQEYKLKNLGEVYHNFSPHGCTGMVCLSESHISFHSWPEHQLLNIDIYLSNFSKDNSSIVQQIFARIVAEFNANILNKEELWR